MRKSQAPSRSSGVKPKSDSQLGTGINAPLRRADDILNILAPGNVVVPASTNADDYVGKNHDETTTEQVPKFKEKIFDIVYGKRSSRKHKVWEGDGTLHVGQKFLTVKDENDKIIGTLPSSKFKQLESGTRLILGGKEIEIVDEKCDEPVLAPTAKAGNITMKRKCDSKSTGILNVSKSRKIQSQCQVDDRLVFPEPPSDLLWDSNENVTVKAVAVDSWLTVKLRPHQRRGIIFLYECISGIKHKDISGAILADEMGLGKTLQCIALIWTLLKQGPFGKPLLRRVLIVTPSSLTGNWASEFKRWLGHERLIPFVLDSKNKNVEIHPNEKVVILSYEMLQRHSSVLSNDFDLIVCDEAHRLKNGTTKVNQVIAELNIPMRILLTGTPIQNDLLEFYSLIYLANPNYVGSYTEYRQRFEDPIVAAKQPEASEDIKMEGEGKAAELNEFTSKFVLRRTHNLLDSYLPSKKEVVVYCRPTGVQRLIYNAVISSQVDCISNIDGTFHLGVIAALRKAANHPGLLLDEDDENKQGSIYAQVLKKVEKDLCDEDITLVEQSGKVLIVAQLLNSLRTTSQERIVLVSNFTQTLDMLEQLCHSQGYPVCRLDGSTPSGQRTKIVERFNSDTTQFVFLLSAKAGGVGLNLTGASRLVLFDSDWNPATDLQSMARIWRDGQRRPVYIYRLLTTGTIEEKIFQRQLSKQNLAGGIVDTSSSSAVQLSRDELKDIFQFCEEIDLCLTHSSLKCDCDGRGDIPKSIVIKESRPCQLSKASFTNTQLRMEELMSWRHFAPPFDDEILPELKLETCGTSISFIFCTDD